MTLKILYADDPLSLKSAKKSFGLEDDEKAISLQKPQVAKF